MIIVPQVPRFSFSTRTCADSISPLAFYSLTDGNGNNWEECFRKSTLDWVKAVIELMPGILPRWAVPVR